MIPRFAAVPILVAALAVLLGTLASCRSLDDRQEVAPADPAGTWIVVELLDADGNATPVPPSAEAFLTFEPPRRAEPGELSGKAGVNRIHAKYSVSAGAVALTPVIATRMAGAPEANAFERRFLELLAGTLRLRAEDGGALVLAGEAGDVRLRRAPR
jgi:heat shock protein HslJ